MPGMCGTKLRNKQKLLINFTEFFHTATFFCFCFVLLTDLSGVFKASAWSIFGENIGYSHHLGSLSFGGLNWLRERNQLI